jgi:hypothetical protein
MEVLVVLEPPTVGKQAFAYLGIPTAVMVIEREVIDKIKQSRMKINEKQMRNPKMHQSDNSLKQTSTGSDEFSEPECQHPKSTPSYKSNVKYKSK